MNREQPGPPLPLLPPPPMPPMPPPPPLPPRENRYHNEGAPYHQGPQPLFGPNDFGPPDAYYQNHNDMRPDMPYYAQESIIIVLKKLIYVSINLYNSNVNFIYTLC